MKKLFWLIFALAGVFASPLTFSQESEDKQSPSTDSVCVAPLGVKLQFDMSPPMTPALKVYAMSTLSKRCFVDSPRAKNTMLVSFTSGRIDSNSTRGTVGAAAASSIAIAARVPVIGIFAKFIPRDKPTSDYVVSVVVFDDEYKGVVTKGASFKSEAGGNVSEDDFRNAFDAVLREFDPNVANRASSR